MRRSSPIRFAAVASLALSTLLSAQSRPAPHAKPAAGTPTTLPATPPSAPPTPTVPELPPTPAQLPAHPADVSYTNGTLSVSATNSSLNQILRDISRQTGMKITGGVVDERVFGQYGPAPAAQVLAMLLDGTGSNVLLVQSGGPAPTELILTPRQGGASPPNPNAAAMDDPDQSDDIPKQSFQPGQGPYRSSPNRGGPPNGQPVEYPASETTRQPDSPNGVKTPQQIYDQLQRMRQQQQQQHQSNPQ
jgi:hypothetical protein